MSDANESIKRIKLLARTYLEDCEDMPTIELVSRLERAAYRMAQEGDASEAMLIFIAIAEIDRLRSA